MVIVVVVMVFMVVIMELLLKHYSQIDSDKPWSHFVATHSTKKICPHALVFRHATITLVSFWKEEKLFHFSPKTLPRHVRN